MTTSRHEKICRIQRVHDVNCYAGSIVRVTVCCVGYDCRARDPAAQTAALGVALHEGAGHDVGHEAVILEMHQPLCATTIQWSQGPELSSLHRNSLEPTGSRNRA